MATVKLFTLLNGEVYAGKIDELTDTSVYVSDPFLLEQTEQSPQATAAFSAEEYPSQADRVLKMPLTSVLYWCNAGKTLTEAYNSWLIDVYSKGS